MSQTPEDRSPTSADADGSARILPFEPRQTEMQRAIQARAFDAMERDRAQQSRRFQPLKWLIILLLSAIPVGITLLAVDGFLRAMQKFMNTASQTPAPPADGEIQYAPPLILQSDEPGVVLIQPPASAPPVQSPAPEAAPPPPESGR